MKKILDYIVEGWCSDSASWEQVFWSLMAISLAFFTLITLLFGWMQFYY